MRNVLVPAALTLGLATALTINVQSSFADPRGNGEGPPFMADGGRPQDGDRGLDPSGAVEMQRAPLGYTPFDRPAGADLRPRVPERAMVNHNFSAARVYSIGPFSGPAGWRYARLRYGDFLPGALLAQQYWLSDFWLFGLDVPPIGYEWVRYGNDVLLVDVATGQIVQAVYDLFR